MTITVTRYIDDFWSAGVPLPSAEAYGMAYVKTAEGDSVAYLGVKVYIEQHGETKEVHLTVHDREEQYPHHIVRYPEFGTVAPLQQLGGVIMGRLVHCQETCSHMKDFKESVANVFRNAMWRGYPRRLVQSVWSRFLFQRWHSTDIRVKELRVWFAKIWSFLAKTGNHHRPEPTQHTETLRSAKSTEFLRVFGLPNRTEAQQPTPSNAQQHREVSTSSNALVPQVQAPQAPQEQSPPNQPQVVMDVDNEDARRLRRGEKRHLGENSEGFRLATWEVRAIQN